MWVNDGSEAVLIHRQLMSQTARQFDDQRHSPLCIQSETHNGFVLMTKLELQSFIDNPAELWDCLLDLEDGRRSD